MSVDPLVEDGEIGAKPVPIHCVFPNLMHPSMCGTDGDASCILMLAMYWRVSSPASIRINQEICGWGHSPLDRLVSLVEDWLHFVKSKTGKLREERLRSSQTICSAAGTSSSVIAWTGRR
jgi:hypothetical protein